MRLGSATAIFTQISAMPPRLQENPTRHFRISSVARRPTWSHTRAVHQSSGLVPANPIPDFQVKMEEVCDQLEELINQSYWVTDSGEFDLETMADVMEFGHKSLRCLSILRDD